MEDKCICCGRVIPEGRHICMNCEHENEMQDFKRKTAKPKTNADRIRQMTDEELAESIGLACKRCAYCAGNKCTGQDKECADGNLKWLKQEVET